MVILEVDATSMALLVAGCVAVGAALGAVVGATVVRRTR